jgi:hypothetical protein
MFWETPLLRKHIAPSIFARAFAFIKPRREQPPRQE